MHVVRVGPVMKRDMTYSSSLKGKLSIQMLGNGFWTQLYRQVMMRGQIPLLYGAQQLIFRMGTSLTSKIFPMVM